MKHKFFHTSVEIKVKKDVITRIHQLFTYRVKVTNQDNDFFYLKISEQDLSKLDQLNIDYQFVSYRGLKHFFRYFVTHVSVLIGIILFLLIIYTNTLTVKEISFSTHTKDNERIETMIKEYLPAIYGINYLNQDLNDLNLKLRKEFSHFEWISVEKNGCNLNVTILEPNVINKQIERMEGFGDLVAKKDGMIKFFQVRQGIPIIEHNQFVRKGQLLVSGNLRYNNNDESEFYIPANGQVFAEVWYTKTVEVPKKIEVKEYTGKISTEKSVVLFGIDFKYRGSRGNYEEYDKEEKIDRLKILSITLPFGVKKTHYLEKNDIINIYNSKTAYEYATSQIRYQMNQSLIEGDKILQIDLLRQSESEDKFTYVFFVKTYEDIALFQRSMVNE